MAGRNSDEQQIANLLFRYADLIDAGRFDEVGALFAHGTYAGVPGAQVADLIRSVVILYEDGTPRTRHVTTNVAIVVGDDDTATSTAIFNVHQCAPGLPLQPILIGTYRDRFERAGGEWRFAERAMEMQLIGDTGHHMRRPPRPGHLTDG